MYLNLAVILNIILSLCKGYWGTVYQLYSASTVQSLKQKAMGEILIYLRIRNGNTITGTLACNSIVMWRFNFDQWMPQGSSPWKIRIEYMPLYRLMWDPSYFSVQLVHTIISWVPILSWTILRFIWFMHRVISPDSRIQNLSAYYLFNSFVNYM